MGVDAEPIFMIGYITKEFDRDVVNKMLEDCHEETKSVIGEDWCSDWMGHTDLCCDEIYIGFQPELSRNKGFEWIDLSVEEVLNQLKDESNIEKVKKLYEIACGKKPEKEPGLKLFTCWS